jgi:integrase
MALYKPKGSAVFVYDFHWQGQRIRESTHQKSITRARQVYEKRKQELRDGTSGIRRQQRPLLFSGAAKEWQERKQVAWSENMQSIAKYALGHLLPVFGKRLLVDIEPRDIAKYQSARRTEGASNRTVNIEVGTLRQIMRKSGAWARISSDVTMLPERQDVGHALTSSEESMLLLECGRSRSRALLPFVTLLIETGSRFNTVRTLTWGNVDFGNRSLKFGKDKTAAGTGRSIPLSRRALDTLHFWAQQFPDRLASHYVFPAEQYGGAGKDETFGFSGSKPLNTDPTRPIGSIKTAWQTAKARTRRHCPECRTGTLADAQKPATGYFCVDCEFRAEELPEGLTKIRLHDARHTFVSRALSARVPLPIIAKIVGWSSSTLAKMAARYGHFGLEELRSAVEAATGSQNTPAFPGSPQISPQSLSGEKGHVN